MKLNLKNPLVFFDLETTGTNINSDRIVEICYLKVYPNGNEEAKTLRINPEMHIPEQASAVHGIYDDDVKDCPTFKDVAKKIAVDIEGCDLAGFNSNRFDIPVLAEEFLRAGVDIDLMKNKFVRGNEYIFVGWNTQEDGTGTSYTNNQPVKNIASEVKKGKLSVSNIDNETIDKHLSTNFMPDPDLLIRTGGEIRLSNYLLWQCAYSELYFCDTYWPDFKEEEFYKAICNYQGRERRYGKTSEQI